MEYRRLLGVFAHPDDEIFAAGLLAQCARDGGAVLIASLTAGEAGRARDSDERGAALARRRARELTASCEALGAAGRALDFPDGGLVDVPRAELVSAIAKLIEEHRPDAVVTFGDDGVYGHRDHLVCARVVEEAVSDQLPLLRTAFPRQRFAAVHRRLRGVRGVLDPSVTAADLGVAPHDADLVLELDDELRDRKRAAVAAHVSQLRDADVDSFLMPGLLEPMLDQEWYTLS